MCHPYKKELGKAVAHERMRLFNLMEAMDQQWINWLEPKVKLSRNAIRKKD